MKYEYNAITRHINKIIQINNSVLRRENLKRHRKKELKQINAIKSYEWKKVIEQCVFLFCKMSKFTTKRWTGTL